MRHTAMWISAVRPHLMITTVRGRFGDVQGRLPWTSRIPTRALDVVIDVNSIDTREAQRDAD